MWPKCPKCRTKDVEISEIWDATITWSPKDAYYNEGILEPGYSKKVKGRCLHCHHVWTFRGIIQANPDWFEGDENENKIYN